MLSVINDLSGPAQIALRSSRVCVDCSFVVLSESSLLTLFVRYKSVKILILSTAFSGLAQRVLTELQQLGHTIEQHYDLEPTSLRNQVERFEPQVILRPFITQKSPKTSGKNTCA
jgi:hypothetical protein